MRVLRDENTRNEAFERFFAHRNEENITQSFKLVAKEMNISVSTIKDWSYKYQWNEMVARKQESMIANIQSQVEEIIGADVNAFCDGIRKLLKPFIEKINSGEIEIRTLKEFNDLASTYTKLQGLMGNGSKSDKGDKAVNVIVVNNIPRPTGDDRRIVDLHADSEAGDSA